MGFRLQFETKGVAFEGDWTVEVARILRHVADVIGEGVSAGRVRDINDNSVGRWEMDTPWTEEAADD